MASFLLDCVGAARIAYSIPPKSNKIVMDNTEEITKKVREYVSNHSKFGKRLMKSYPNLKVLKKRYKRKIKKLKNKKDKN